MRNEIVAELHERNVKFNCNAQAKYLQNLLDTEMDGIQILPALLFDNPLTNLDEVGLDQYEILNNEPLHGISHHAQNLYDENSAGSFCNQNIVNTR